MIVKGAGEGKNPGRAHGLRRGILLEVISVLFYKQFHWLAGLFPVTLLKLGRNSRHTRPPRVYSDSFHIYETRNSY
jgi:hypothetical protein